MNKTTKMMEKAVSLLAEMPDNHKVYITGAHLRWVKELEKRFKSEGLVDVVFLSPYQVKYGALRGALGYLLIDDFHDLPIDLKDVLTKESYILKLTTERALYGTDATPEGRDSPP